MIRYALHCDAGHAFESWFRDSDAFDRQSRARLVGCPVCGSSDVKKSLMAPSVVTARRRSVEPAAAPPPTSDPTPAPMALLGERAQKLRSLMRELREHVIRTSDDVGAAFPDEARKMHEGVIEHRAIRGEASPDDVRGLLEDGIDIMPLPVLPDERN
jgi:hypothetical protein